MENISVMLKESVEYIRTFTNLEPNIGIILGSGLGDFAETLIDAVKIPTNQIPHFPTSTVVGHKGFLVAGRIENTPIWAVQGRTHYYEGHDIDKVAYVVRLLSELGIQVLLVTNAAGGVNPRFTAGDLMIIVDHINFMFRNPLRGPVVEKEVRWPDMNFAYDKQLIEIIEQAGLDLKIPLKKGVLFVSTGPTYETAAEVQMVRKFGGDAVSMSTVPEVLVARARGIRVAGISCITNPATGISQTPLSHDEVTKVAEMVKVKFQNLIKEVILRIAKSSW
ncbi:MAG: purine nucleoside phosphorylase I, inosine and guanosine-specific [Calditrichia bacterium]